MGPEHEGLRDAFIGLALAVAEHSGGIPQENLDELKRAEAMQDHEEVASVFERSFDRAFDKVRTEGRKEGRLDRMREMPRRLAPILFDEDDPEAAKAQRASPVEPAKPSPSARSKAASKRARDGTAAHSLHTLLTDLSTVALNDISVGGSGSFKVVTTPTPGQRKAFELLGVDPAKMFPAAGR